MDYLSKPSKDDLKSYLHTFNNCAECRLHKNRKCLVLGKGSIHASVVILLDRVSVRAAYNGNIMDGGEGQTLQQVLRFVAEDYPIIRSSFLWVTPTVLCPTQRLGRQEMLPTPSAKEQTACFSRLSEEIHYIQPEIIIACGTAAYKTTTATGSGSYDESLGRVVEAHITGDVGTYPVPMMVTYSMNQLLRNPTQNVGGVWNKTVGHFKQAIATAKLLADKRRTSHGL